MKIISSKDYLVLFLYTFVVLHFTFTPVQYLVNLGSEYSPYFIGIIISFFVVFSYVRTKMFIPLILYIIIVFLDYLFKENINLGNSLAESFNLLVTAFMAYYVLTYSKSKIFMRLLLLLFVLITLVHTVQTFRFQLSFPGIMRFAAMKYNFEEALPLFIMGLAPYQFPHAITCVIPAFVLGLKIKNQEKKKKIICWVLLISSLVLVYITQATGALIVAVFALVLSVIVKVDFFEKNWKKIIVVSFLIIPVAISDSIQLGIIQTAEEIVGPDSHYLPKLEELENSITIDSDSEGDINYRGNLLGITIESILTHPIFGVSDDAYGNHNALLDRWAIYGSLGFIPLVIFIFYQIRFTLRKIPIKLQTFYIIGVASNLLMMLSKNMFAWHQWFMFLVILPVSILYFANEEDKINYTK